MGEKFKEFLSYTMYGQLMLGYMISFVFIIFLYFLSNLDFRACMLGFVYCGVIVHLFYFIFMLIEKFFTGE